MILVEVYASPPDAKSLEMKTNASVPPLPVGINTPPGLSPSNSPTLLVIHESISEGWYNKLIILLYILSVEIGAVLIYDFPASDGTANLLPIAGDGAGVIPLYMIFFIANFGIMLTVAICFSFFGKRLSNKKHIFWAPVILIIAGVGLIYPSIVFFSNIYVFG
jgi:hypothetical protein